MQKIESKIVAFMAVHFLSPSLLNGLNEVKFSRNVEEIFSYFTLIKSFQVIKSLHALVRLKISALSNHENTLLSNVILFWMTSKSLTRIS